MTSDAALQRATKALTVHRFMREWFASSSISQADVARMVGMTRQHFWQVVQGIRELPDDAIGHLPDGLRQRVGEIRARRYEGLAASVRHSAGIEREPVKQQALQRGAQINSEPGRLQ